jgi:hypothetical protein
MLIGGAHLEPRPRLQFRYNQTPKLWKAITPDSTHADWFDIFQTNIPAKPINARNVAFGLFLASRSTYNESSAVFYEENHFVFEDRFNLYMFIKSIGENNAKLVRSVTMNWRKSTKKHSAKIREENRRWKLWFELRHGPTFFHSLQNHSSESKANVSLSLNFTHYARLAIMWNLPTLRFL